MQLTCINGADYGCEFMRIVITIYSMCYTYVLCVKILQFLNCFMEPIYKNAIDFNPSAEQ